MVSESDGLSSGPTGDGAAVGVHVPIPLPSARVTSLVRAVFEFSRDAIGVLQYGVHLFVNPAYRALFGIPPDAKLTGTPILDLIAPASRDLIREHIGRRTRDEPLPALYETRGRRSDGSTFAMEVAVSSCREEGEVFTLVILRDITARTAAAAEIAECGAMLQQVMDTASVAIFLVDKGGRITSANGRMAEMFDCAIADLVGSEYVAHIQPSERETGCAKMLALLANEIPAVDLECRYRRADGTAFWGHLAGRRFQDACGNDLGLIGVITDIDQRKQAETALRTAEERIRWSFDDSPLGAAIVTPDMRFQSVNARLCEFTGYTSAELVGRSFDDLSHPQDVAAGVAAVRGALAGETDFFQQERRYIRKDGAAVWARTSVRLIRDGKGEPQYSLPVIEDITEFKRSELALRESEAKYRRLYNETPVLLHSIDRSGILVEVNDHWLKTLGYAREEMIGRKVIDFYSEASRAYALQVVQPAFFREGVVKDIAYQFVKKNGAIVDVLLAATAERDANGVVVRSQAVSQDITERKLAEESLRESEERFKAITTTASDAILLMDDTGKIVYWNPAAGRMFGYAAEEALGADLHMLLAPPRLHGNFHAGFGKFAGTGQGPVIDRAVELTAIRKDGTEFPIEVSTSAMSIRGRWHALGIIRDSTERRRLEQELLRSQKLESIGTLAGGIAHDFNNLLQGVFGFIGMAKLALDRPQKSFAMLEQAEKALHQSVRLTAQLLTFSKGGKPVKKVIALAPVIESAARFALSGSRIDLRLSCASDLWAAEADEGQIGQVIQNIVLNADQAMPLGGTLAISAQNVPTAKRAVPELPPLDFVEIVVRDCGTGIPAEHLARIFDPYFTTKAKGSGLGLATSYSIVKNHGGVITVASEAGRGATFAIYLPASAQPIAAPPLPAPAARVRHARILVMDDEAIVREVTAELIDALGHDAEFAEHGESALEKFRAARAAEKAFDVVILDLTIRGGMGGLETMRRLRELDPAVPVIVSSGYSDDDSVAEYRMQGFVAFLKKPYNLLGLRDVLTPLLG